MNALKQKSLFPLNNELTIDNDKNNEYKNEIE